MLRKIIIIASIAMTGVMATAVPAAAQTAPAAYSSGATTIGDLLDNPETRAVLVKHLPGFADNPQIDMARGMTLKQIQNFAADTITDEVLAKVDADLAKIAAKK